MIDKLKPFRQTPDNIRECQMEADKVLEEDLDKEVTEPFVDPDDSKARIDHIQCADVVPYLEDHRQTQECMDPVQVEKDTPGHPL